MQPDLNEFKSILDELHKYKSIIAYATNTIRIIFLTNEDERVYFFHIDPPWRISLNNSLIQTSYNYPYHDDYSEQDSETENRDFRAWCSATEFMKNEKIKSIYVNEHYDLTIAWENGAALNTFSNDLHDPSFFFYDKIINTVYEFSYKNCTKSNLKPRDKGKEKC